MARLPRSLAGLAVLLLTLSGASACAFPGDSIRDEEGIIGTYTVNGVDPVGIEYSGTVTIVETDVADEYAVEWIVTGTIQQGTGRLDGDRFEVEWVSVTDATDFKKMGRPSTWPTMRSWMSSTRASPCSRARTRMSISRSPSVKRVATSP